MAFSSPQETKRIRTKVQLSPLGYDVPFTLGCELSAVTPLQRLEGLTRPICLSECPQLTCGTASAPCLHPDLSLGVL